MDFTPILRADADEISADENILWENLRGTTVLVTGGTGVIGSAVVRALIYANDNRKLNIKVIVVGRDAAKTKLIGHEGFVFINADLRQPFYMSGEVDYIIHLAGMRKSKDMVDKPVDVIETAVCSTQNMLKLAETKQVKGMVYVSSMEVYADVDTENVRSSYPESKRLCECLCKAYQEQYGVNVNFARLSLTFGAGSDITDPIAAIQFGKSAYLGDDIILHTEGRSMGNFCYISDAVRALLTILLKGEKGKAYDVANPEASLTIREFAETIARDVCEDRIKVRIEIPDDIAKRGYAKDSHIKLDISKLRTLGWSPKHSVSDMYMRLFSYWREKEYPHA